MSNNKTTGLIVLLVALLIGGAVYAFKSSFEQKERVIRTGFLGEARTNPLFASRVFLKRMGIPTLTQTTVESLQDLPHTDTVIIINSKRRSISPKQNQKLIEWVKSGGHLIALASHKWRYYRSDADFKKESENNAENDNSLDHSTAYNTDPLQAFLGVSTESRIYYDDLSEKEQEFVDDIETKNGDLIEESLYKIQLKDTENPFSIMNMWFNPIIKNDNHRKFPKPAEMITLRGDQFILRQAVDAGLITLVSSLQFVENRHLDQADHAELLWTLIHGQHKSIEQPKAVWLIHQDKVASLWTLLWHNAWAFILTLSVLLVAWFLVQTRRFGPVIPKESTNRRSLNEHIISSGRYYWKHDNQKLLKSAQATLNQTLMSRYPNWANLAQAEQIEVLLEAYKDAIPSVNKQPLINALFSENINNTDEFTQAIKLIERIRKDEKERL